ncbi:hypothetical protein C8R43DRAFT_993969 [Mycena crocata]|nr:hypothetical protein C8R43DRAFT_993969 [Mycena crocata]
MSAASSERDTKKNGGGLRTAESESKGVQGEGEKEQQKDVKAGGGKAAGPAGGFFAWVGPAVRTRRTLKTWARCVLVVAAAMVLLVDHATLTTMGQAGFFAAIVAVLLPPSLALSVFTIASLTLIIGMLLGWAWGAACMAAGLAVQDKALLATRQAAAQQGLVAGISPTLQIQSLIFHGFFLDPRTSAVYGALLFIGTFGLGALRAAVPKLALLSIFGTIVVDVYCTTGPLLPTAQYTVAKQFLIPTCYYLAIALASLIFVFPESLNHIWLTTLDQMFFGPAVSILSLQATTLGTRPSDHDAWAKGAAKVSAARAGLAGGLGVLAAQIGLIDLEVSVGRLGPGDLKRLAPELRALGFRASGLMAFQSAVTAGNADDALALAAAEKEQADGKTENASSPANTSEKPTPLSTPKLSSKNTQHTRFAIRRRRIHAREARHGHTLDELVPILSSASAPLRAASSSGMEVLRAWFLGCNTGRWTGFFFGSGKNKANVEERQAGLAKARDDLGAALEAFRKVERVKLIAPFERFFDKETGRLVESIGRWRDDPEMFAVRSLFICFVFCDSLDAFAARLHRILVLVADLDKRRTAPRIWMPSGFGKIGSKIISREAVTVDTQPLAMGTASDPTKFEEPSRDSIDGDGETETAVDPREEKEEAAVPARNPDARPPTSALGRLFVALGACMRFFKSPNGIFALRHAVVSVALWIPAVVPSTAWFYYDNKGMWALIMAQMGLATFAGDQLFGLATRLVGTGAGLLNGMVVWYIAAPGKANGNAYAVVVVTAVFVAPFMLARIASPPAQMMFWTMVGVTTVFVVGYSWLDTHFALISNAGVGITVGWKRAVLVIIGFTAGGIVMMFPRPTSSRVLVRRTLAATLQELGSIFGQEVEAFLAEEARARSGHFEQETIDFMDTAAGDVSAEKVSPKERRVRKVAQRVMTVFERLQGLAPSLQTGRWEPQVQGLWPHEQYELLHAKETKLITSIALLAGAFSKLNTKWCSILVHRTPFLNPNLLSDIFSTVDILSHALEAGHPVPASLPNLRERLVYHEALVRSLDRNASRSQPAPSTNIALPPKNTLDADDTEDSDSESSTTSEFVAGKVEGASIGFEELSLSVLMDEQLPTHSTAVIALGSILTLIDEIGVIVRELCGETTFRGFDALHHEFLRREEAAMGTFAQR